MSSVEEIKQRIGKWEKRQRLQYQTLPPELVASLFLTRWYTPDLITAARLTDQQLTDIGIELQAVERRFLETYDWERQESLLSFGSFHFHYGKRDPADSLALWQQIRRQFDLSKLRLGTGQTIISQFDLLVTTPLSQSLAHAQEAAERLAEFQTQGTIGYYYRVFNPWMPPAQLRIGTKIFYVDSRAITGFAVVTDLLFNESDHGMYTMMDADTWCWIKPISCDYSAIKPPQRYAYALKHSYLKGITAVEIVGSWLDRKP